MNTSRPLRASRGANSVGTPAVGEVRSLTLREDGEDDISTDKLIFADASELMISRSSTDFAEQLHSQVTAEFPRFGLLPPPLAAAGCMSEGPS